MNQVSRKRQADGKGIGTHSWKKHWMVGKLLTAQAAKLRHVFGPGGAILDMHAGDGDGAEEPQGDFFGASASETTAALAVAAAIRFDATAWLCEILPNKRAKLVSRFGASAQYLSDHADLLELSLSAYPWVIVINDPCGHGDGHNGIKVMSGIAQRVRYSDFIVCVNEGSLKRHLGVSPIGDDAGHPNANAIRGVRDSAAKYEWMLEPKAWGMRLGKAHGASARTLSSNHAYKGRVLLLTNSLATLNPQVFGSW